MELKGVLCDTDLPVGNGGLNIQHASMFFLAWGSSAGPFQGQLEDWFEAGMQVW